MLVGLLGLMVWLALSEPSAAVNLDANKAKATPTYQTQVTTPKAKPKTFELTFEDELPNPMVEQQRPKIAPVYNYEDRHVLALIIDDVGYDMHALERLLALPFTITVSVLPDAPYAEEAARMAHQHGVKVMLHMPMQTSNPKYKHKMEQFYLHTNMSQAQFTKVFEDALAKVPYAEGVNNHMGSMLTSDAKSMQWLMALCEKHRLFFVDSRTSSKSVAADYANRANIDWNSRDIFLDHSVEPAKLKHAWESAMDCVQRNDHCVMLAHPHKETIQFLEQQTSGFGTQNFVAITQALKS
ncbi:MAG: hypothetical protein AUK35_08575 [Zetaproteobacteria bacterium CG2_30_46_52]|nr:MAG: hypothetical protein AUK35_08575 [Zetaproteobacteria bacterium CG2_30_46_52]